MNRNSLQQYIDQGIVPAVALGFKVEECDISKRVVTLSAPLSLNKNDKGTLFAGSSASLATLTCWSLAQSLANTAAGVSVPVVAKETQLKYLNPVTNCDRVFATCRIEDPKILEQFTADYKAKGKAYLTLSSVVYPDNNPQTIGLSLTGTFVALPIPK